MESTISQADGAGSRFVTVLIPTYNRVDQLIHTLECLEAQTERDFAIVVVDDGSTDGTAAALAAFVARTKLAITQRTQPNGGPAKARNLGLSLVSSPIVLMIGDDTYPESGFVAAHAAFHRAHPDVRAGAVGHTQWCETRQDVTRFMRWLDMDGQQFGYRELLAGGRPCWRHFYTSNLSLKTALTGPAPFDETFPAAAMEDIEAGWRLEVGRGLRLHFLPDAVVRHVHPMTFRGACRRAVWVGAGLETFAARWPEHRRAPRPWWKRVATGLLTRPLPLSLVTALADRWTERVGPGRLTLAVLHLHQAIGRRGYLRR